MKLLRHLTNESVIRKLRKLFRRKSRKKTAAPKVNEKSIIKLARQDALRARLEQYQFFYNRRHGLPADNPLPSIWEHDRKTAVRLSRRR